MNKTISAVILLSLLLLFNAACKKTKNNNDTPPDNTNVTFQNGLTVFEGSSLANTDDAAQGVNVDSIHHYTTYFYGSYDGNGEPLQLKHAIVQRNDTSLVMDVDDSERISRMYLIVNNTAQNVIVSFNYYLSDSVQIVVSTIDWNTGSQSLKQITTVGISDTPYSVVSNTAFKGTQVNFLRFVNSFAGRVAFAATIIGSTTVLGFLAGSGIPGIGNVTGGLIGFAIGFTTVFSSSANAAEVAFIPGNVPKMPATSTKSYFSYYANGVFFQADDIFCDEADSEILGKTNPPGGNAIQVIFYVKNFHAGQYVSTHYSSALTTGTCHISFLLPNPTSTNPYYYPGSEPDTGWLIITSTSVHRVEGIFHFSAGALNVTNGSFSIAHNG